MMQGDVSALETQEAVEQVCWRFLADACKQRDAGMHNMVISTVRDGVPMSRVVVLRRVDMDVKKLYFHTDIRKDLVEDINADGMVSWLGYDKLLRTQIRIFGRATPHHKDELAAEHWLKTQHYSRRCYLQPESPGTLSDGSEHKVDQSDFSYSREESEAGFENFVVVETQAHWMDWYFTHSRGNRRARFAYDKGNLTNMCWLHA